MQRREPTSPVAPIAPNEPPREHRSRAPEFYGFVAWTSTSVAFVLYVLWALLPDEYIVWLGVEWYPSREWSLLLPAYSIILVLLTYFVYFSLAIAHTPSFNDVSALVDSKGHLPAWDVSNPYLKHADSDAVPELYDIPIGIVNRVLYGPGLHCDT
ncbi:PIG-P-domain-containing protein [Melanogaster broomeanus]|nr:PIG-P-domain-containing protein [Melanogaster broomeanus]